MARLGYKKAYDIVPHSWIIDCLETVGKMKRFEEFWQKA